MMRGMFAAISGLKVHQTALDATANNLANVNTIGYKGSRASFADSLSQLQRGGDAPGAGTAGTNPVQVGLGVQLATIANTMSGGALQSTGNPLDVAIQGEGFLRVGQGTPPAVPTELLYTRAGQLTTNSAGHLVTVSGQYVVGREFDAGPPPGPGAADTLLLVPPGSTNVAIGQDGSVSYIDQDTASPTFGDRVVAGYVSLAKFSNQAGLERVGGSLWAESQNSGTPVVGTPSVDGYGATIAGQVEMSNVDIANEFTSMISAQRGFQANSRVITTVDEMLQMLVTMKR